MIRFLLTLVLAAVSSAASAACSDRDLIAEMTPEARASLEQRSNASPFAKGLLWQAMRGDQRIVLFGTYHMAHPRTQAQLATLRPMIESADRVYLEMSAADSEMLKTEVAKNPDIMFITSGPTLPDMLGEEDWATLSAAYSARGIPPIVGSRFKPIWASSMLAISPCALQAGQAGGKGIDGEIARIAQEAGVPDLSLEHYTTTLSLLDSFPREQQVEMLRMSFQLDTDPDALTNTLLRAYLRQEIALIRTYFQDRSEQQAKADSIVDSALLESLLITQRNQAWVALLSELPAKSDVFAAFGAAHLTGKDGVLNLLQADGYAVTPLAFDP